MKREREWKTRILTSEFNRIGPQQDWTATGLDRNRIGPQQDWTAKSDRLQTTLMIVPLNGHQLGQQTLW